MPQQKDPKKVEAGRKGAAIKKAKQERLLDELREAKASLVVKQEEHLNVAPAEQKQKNRAEGTAVSVIPTLADWTPYVACGLGIAALWFLYSGRGNHSMAPTSTPQERVSPVKMPALKQLKTGTDPFYMP